MQSGNLISDQAALFHAVSLPIPCQTRHTVAIPQTRNVIGFTQSPFCAGQCLSFPFPICLAKLLRQDVDKEMFCSSLGSIYICDVLATGPGMFTELFFDHSPFGSQLANPKVLSSVGHKLFWVVRFLKVQMLDGRRPCVLHLHLIGSALSASARSLVFCHTLHHCSPRKRKQSKIA